MPASAFEYVVHALGCTVKAALKFSADLTNPIATTTSRF
jgi:hypothetical protein